MALRGFPAPFGPPSPVGSMGSIGSPPASRPPRPAPPRPGPASAYARLRSGEAGGSISVHEPENNEPNREKVTQHDSNKVFLCICPEHPGDSFPDPEKTNEDTFNDSAAVDKTKRGTSRNETNIQDGLEQNDTIFYDPFDDVRIQLGNTIRDDGNSDRNRSSNLSRYQDSHKEYKERPKTIDSEIDVGVSDLHRSTPLRLCYGDSFRLAPLPVDERREPPPPYDTDRVRYAVDRTTNITRVVMPDTAIHLDGRGDGRRHLYCQHCGHRVYSVVTRQYGLVTHALAFIFLITCLLPFILLVYCTNLFTYKHHYCPNCNQVIGYEAPMTCQKISYVK